MWYWIFAKESTKKYIIMSDDDLIDKDENTIRFDIENDGYELFCDCMKSYQGAAAYMREFYEEYEALKLSTSPINFDKAKEFVDTYHRHHASPQGYKFAVALSDGDITVGVAIAGRPVSRFRDNGVTLEVTRLCVKNGYKNACSMLYSAITRIAKELGYKNILTYTLENESGKSLLAAGFEFIGITQGKSWSNAKRPREDKHPLCNKKIWQYKIAS